MTYGDVIIGWKTSRQFRAFFTSLVLEPGYSAFFWETIPVNSASLDHSFEFALVEAPELIHVRPDPKPFEVHFSKAALPSVTAFPNLGGDALLIVPSPLGQRETYTHLAAFLRKAPASQIDDFWQAVGLHLQARINSKPLWVSTAGLGVSWLHLRLDTRPKYYRHQPYTAPPV